jgi:hypothetical protein
MKAISYVNDGADWILFHTRFATSGGFTSRSCHPFRSGQLVMAHNGHSFTWDKLGASIGISDSECITHAWSRLHLPIEALGEVEGVFIGFQGRNPFVVKGTSYNDLTVSVHEKTGAILFVSDLNWLYRCLFDHTVEVGRFLWSGGPLDISKVEPRQRFTTKYTTTSATSTSSGKTQTADTHQVAGKGAETKKTMPSMSLAQLQQWYRDMEEEEAVSTFYSAPPASKPKGKKATPSSSSQTQSK